MTVNNDKAREALQSLRELRRARSRWSKKRLNRLQKEEQHEGRALWIASAANAPASSESATRSRFPPAESRSRVRDAFIEASERDVTNARKARKEKIRKGRKLLMKRRKKGKRKQKRRVKRGKRAGKDDTNDSREDGKEEVGAKTKEMFEQDSSILEHLMLRQKKKDDAIRKRVLSRRSKERQASGRSVLDGLEKDKAFLAGHILTFKEWQQGGAGKQNRKPLAIDTTAYSRGMSPGPVISPSNLGKIEEMRREIGDAPKRVTWSRELVGGGNEHFGGGSILADFDGVDESPLGDMGTDDDPMRLIESIRDRLEALEVDRVASPPAVNRSVQRSYQRRMGPSFSNKSVIADYFQDNPLSKSIRPLSGEGSSSLRLHAGRQLHKIMRGISSSSQAPLPFDIPKEVQESTFSLEDHLPSAQKLAKLEIVRRRKGRKRGKKVISGRRKTID